MTIEIDGLYRVKSGDAYAFTDEDGFLLDGTAPRLVNAGRIAFTQTVVETGLAVIDASTDGASFWNQAGGRLLIDTSASATIEAIPIVMSGEGDLLRNDAAVTMRGGQWIVGALGVGAGFRFDNNGLWKVSALDVATGAYLGADTQADNAGSLIVSSAADGATGIALLGSGAGPAQIVNTGLIHVEGPLGAVGLGLYDAIHGGEVDNGGRLIAHTGPGGNPSIGVMLQGGGDGWVGIDNSGLIRADIAIESYSGAGVIANSGKIAGDILLAASADRVVNTGHILGDVELGGGADFYDGIHGLLVGAINGGGGADTLFGGREDDVIHGDEPAAGGFGDGDDVLGGARGDDLLIGGGGDDSLGGGQGADTLIGGLGADLLIGGSGSNSFVFLSVADSTNADPDHIGQFGKPDLIDLSAIDADVTTDGDQAFHIVKAFSGHAGELVLTNQTLPETIVQGDVDGDGLADFTIVLQGYHQHATNFVL